MSRESVLDLLGRWQRWRAVGIRLLAVVVLLGWIGAICSDWMQDTGTLPESTPIHASELKLFRSLAEDVRSGENFYDAYNRRLRTLGYPVASVVRWRLPILSWLGAGLQSDSLVRGSAIALSLLAWSLALIALRELALLDRMILAGSLAGVAVWPFIGESQYTYELWAGLLISISASLSTMGRHKLAPAFGIAAIAVRELALPYCLCAAVMAWWCGRRFEWRAWLAGLIGWGLFYLWHSHQVHLHVSPAEWAASDSVLPWLSFGGLEFVLRTARMNALLIFLPGSVAYVVLVAALLGLAAMRGDTGWILLAALVSFLVAFFVVGQEFNGYWGVVYAPLVPIGLAHTRQALATLWAQHRNPQPGRIDNSSYA